MKKIIASCVAIFFAISVHSQTVIIKGRIRCLNQHVNSSKGAENIVVVPAFIPAKSTITVTQPPGYFEFNTGVLPANMHEKKITVYIISRCTSCKEIAQSFFYTEDQDRRNRNDGKYYYTIKEWMLKTNCEKAELSPISADSILNVVVKLPGQDLNKISPATALATSPALLNLLGNISSVTYLIGNFGTFYVDSIGVGRINYGKMQFSSPLYQSANTGFNFSPSRDMSEAALWNPSAVALSPKPYNISLLTNVKNMVKLTGFAPIGKNLSITVGGIYNTQNEFVRVRFAKIPPPLQPINIDSIPIGLKEYAAYLGLAYKVNRKLGLSISAKSIWQDMNIPSVMNVLSNAPSILTDSVIKKQHFDVDLSATYKITRYLQVGINLMNLAGTKLHSAPYAPSKLYPAPYTTRIPDIRFQKQRSAALGLLYRWKRLNVGADVLFTEDGFFDAAFGVNYVPFNNALLSAGITVKQLSYSFSFRVKHFRLAYINDNDWMVNERKKNKSALLNGRIYGGFVFNLSKVIY
jgi:hypothetical protein